MCCEDESAVCPGFWHLFSKMPAAWFSVSGSISKLAPAFVIQEHFSFLGSLGTEFLCSLHMPWGSPDVLPTPVAICALTPCKSFHSVHVTCSALC